MSAKITHNITVITGKYQVNGEEKASWETVGARWVKDDGGVFFTMKRTFNPAGVFAKDDSKDIFLQMIEVKEEEKPKQKESL